MVLLAAAAAGAGAQAVTAAESEAGAGLLVEGAAGAAPRRLLAEKESKAKARDKRIEVRKQP